MGSLTSRPTVPQVRQPVFVTVPQPAPQSAPVSTPAVNNVEEPNAGTSGAEAKRLAREDNLLRRGRGRLGTVLTGLGGILSQATAPVRKTLLGE